MFRVLVILLIGLASGFGQAPGRDQVAEKRYRDELAAVAPGSLTDFDEATRRMDAGKYESAISLFAAVAQAAPGFDPAERRLGSCMALSGKRAEGIAILEGLLARSKTPENLASLATALSGLGSREAVTTPDLERALGFAMEAAGSEAAKKDPQYLATAAQIALQLQNWSTFRTLTQKMEVQLPNSMMTHYFLSIRALMDGNQDLAKKEIERSQQLGLPAATAQMISKAIEKTRSPFCPVMRFLFWAFVIWALGLAALFVVGKTFSAKALASIEAADPNEATVSASEQRLRSVYRKLVQLAASYYYISMPFVAILVVVAAALMIFAFLYIGYIPIYLILATGIGALVTLYRMVQAFFTRIPSDTLGRELKEEDAPALWSLVREVAERVGTRPVDEIRLLPGTEMAVYESGSKTEKTADRSRRVLLLGFGVVQGFRLNAFRAVLAHEYGHFSHRDTAGGDVALKMQRHLMKFVLALVHSRQASIWNVAIHFIRLYHFLFRRIAHGATRLQEVLADRVSAKLFGPAALEEGLRHVIRRTVEFQSAVALEVRGAVQAQRPLANLYSLAPADPAEVERAVDGVMLKATTEEDTHPCPLDRFRYVGSIPEPHVEAADGEVVDLFLDPAALSAALTEQVGLRVG